jgi:pimeloyl-ACP methyl ester carboxylesterase
MAHPHFIDATTVDVPAIVIVGENDKNYVASGEYFGEKLPNAKKIVVKDAGHPAALEQPDVVNGAVRQFLDELKLS